MHTGTSRPRWRDAPEPRTVPAQPAPGVLRGAGRSSRRRKLLVRGVVPAAAVLSVLLVVGVWANGPSAMSPAEVARSAHDEVVRDVIRRTGDYSMTIGPLDCVEIQPGRGNCLADARSASHRADGLMVAVGYVVDPADGQLELVVKLP